VRAFQLHNRIQGLEKKADILEEVLNQVHAAIVLLDSCGRALFVNEQAGDLFQQQRYVRLTPNGIHVTRPSEHKQLAGLIQGAIETGTGRSCHPGGTMNLSRGDSQRPLQVLVSPLRSEAVFLGKARPVAIIFITDPDRKSSTSPEALQQLYRLTPAESRLAQLLASGNTLKEASEQLGVAMSTVRSQLKSLFAKTNTNRQSELMRLLLLSPTFPPGQDFKIIRNSDGSI
jgi:DNA-binding CsgD family transcriptional regulator